MGCELHHRTARQITINRIGDFRLAYLRAETINSSEAGARRKGVDNARWRVELQEFGIEMSTINTGPFLIGFNDRGCQTLAELGGRAFRKTVRLLQDLIRPPAVWLGAGIHSYRNLEPKPMLEEAKHNIEAQWTAMIRDGLGSRSPAVQRCYDMKPETSVASS